MHSQHLSSSHTRRAHHHIWHTRHSSIPSIRFKPMVVPNHSCPAPLSRFIEWSHSHPWRTYPTHAIQRLQHVNALSLSPGIWNTRLASCSVFSMGEVQWTALASLLGSRWFLHWWICVVLIMFVVRFEPVLGGVVGVMTGSYLGKCHIYGV